MITTNSNRKDNRSTTELIRDLSAKSVRLIFQEMVLARPELTDKRVQAGLGIGLLGRPTPTARAVG